MKTTILIALLMLSQAAMAGGNHFHPKKIASCSGNCTKEQISAAVPAALDELINWEQLDAKWKTAKSEAIIEKKLTKGAKAMQAFIVPIVDSSTSKKKYVFFTQDGTLFKVSDSMD
ncbi:MAG: DUF6488 family protein [Bacteriovoracia bacterium]